MWSEAASALHSLTWRRELRPDDGRATLERLASAPIRSHPSADLTRSAWEIADELGWARTYDAEYLALARRLQCRVVTVDLRFRRGANRTGQVVTPDEL